MNIVKIQSKNKLISYEDDIDHFKNGLLTLLSLTESDFQQWLDLSEQSGENNLLKSLEKGFIVLRPLKSKIIDRDIWHNSIAENPNFGVAKNIEGNIAWLVKYNGEKYIRETEPPIYEENYFEGDKLVAGGYGQYSEQSNWRLEKATRQVKELIDITNIKSGNVLDIGSGYGYFRKALDDLNFKHDGIEISKFAVDATKQMYGFDTNIGIVSDYLNKFQNKFDIVSLFDVIEHISDTQKFLQDIYSLIKPGGFIIIKTPNIKCPEADVFGAHYHSLKREHLVYFSNVGLIDSVTKIGFKHHKSLSNSHLLKGFVGEGVTKKWADSLKGSDLISYFKK